MDFAGIHGEIEPFQDIAVVDPDLKIFDFKQRHMNLSDKSSSRRPATRAGMTA